MFQIKNKFEANYESIIEDCHCPSNPRSCAFKRHYKKTLAIFIFCLVDTNVSAFGVNPNVYKPKISETTGLNLSLRTLENELDVKIKGLNTRGGMDAAAVYQEPSRFVNVCDFIAERSPGVALSVALAQLSVAIGNMPLGNHVSPLLWATILGMGYGNLLHKGEAKRILSTGIKFSKGRLLRLGIILYGFKITLQQIAGIGLAGLGTDVFMVATTLVLGIVLGTKVFKLDEATSTLIGSGAAICGCSAVLATQPIVGGESHQVSAAVGTVVLGGTASMFIYPLLFKYVPFLASSPNLMGIYTGSTIHEIAGVVAAGNAMGVGVASTAVVTKLARVLLLAPVLTILSWRENRKCQREAEAAGIEVCKEDCKIVLPWFAFCFVAISALNSAVTFPTALVKTAGKVSAFSLVCAMAALGVDSDFKEIQKLGRRPLLLAAALWGWLTFGGLGVARFFLGV